MTHRIGIHHLNGLSIRRREDVRRHVGPLVDHVFARGHDEIDLDVGRLEFPDCPGGTKYGRCPATIKLSIVVRDEHRVLLGERFHGHI